ncbi:MAG: DEAD/DEAH box helicase family protein [Myxococcales bacterium]|nr:DEAD/DEAH box helicase family protein [Myxococcales bacterium]
MSIQILFEHGTLVVPTLTGEADAVSDLLTLDPRTGRYRAPARLYRHLILRLRELGLSYEDHARGFEELEVALPKDFSPYPHQAEALSAWMAAGFEGVVEMPTGSGKTLLGAMAIAACQRSALVIVPTIELLHQWKGVLEANLQQPVGIIGGGQKDRQAITVVTYDSAAMQVEFWGHRFGCLVFDEVHHLPSTAYRFIAEGSIAPFRLGLSATLARSDGEEHRLVDLVGSTVYQAKIEALEGSYLAPYEVVTLTVALDDEDRVVYEQNRDIYLAFLRSERIPVSRAGGWMTFVSRAHQSPAGRAAFQAYRRQRGIAVASEAKLRALWGILVRHRLDRVLIFTEDTESVYRISEKFFVPCLTYQTPPRERKQLLAQFASGEIRTLVAAKVLNEGIDVPEANVGVVLSGSGSIREHVQRLGRILRPRPGKQAILYEMISDVAAEMGISERRRRHEAYGRTEQET